MVSFLRLLLPLFLIVSLNAEERYPIIPKPAGLTPVPGVFKAKKSMNIWLTPYNEKTEKVARFLTDFLSKEAIVLIKNSRIRQKRGDGDIDITLNSDETLSKEAYTLSISPQGINIASTSTKGIFWAIQTLKQLAQIKNNQLEFPCVEINDFPRFSYRGLMLDVSRHMYSVPFIKKLLDNMALYKLNTFHWHLTDDQGWRIEIKKYPQLQEVAAFRHETLIGHKKSLPHRFDGKRYGGYYTQEQVKEIIDYARRRHITIIPEIELPGHSLAALAAYPELGCTGGPYAVGTVWGINEDIYCAGKEDAFTFLENVLSEVVELFPSKYIHIGGDEAPKTRWKGCSHCQERIKSEQLKDESGLQSYFVQRIEKFLNSKGRQIIGWDEILEGGLAPNATVMSWTGIKGGIEASRLHHPAIMTPYTHVYLDFYQSKSSSEPLAIQGFTPLKKVYEYEPIPEELKPDERKWIKGVQANVWTEYMKTEEHVEYMTFPRALALAELAWTPLKIKNFDDFVGRLKPNLRLLDSTNTRYAAHAIYEQCE